MTDIQVSQHQQFYRSPNRVPPKSAGTLTPALHLANDLVATSEFHAKCPANLI